MSAIAHRFQPLDDPRWGRFLQSHPRAAIFHTGEWLHALRRTYGYDLIGFTTSRPDAELRNAMVFCRVKSGITGHCLVSLPFSDHCEPLVETEDEFEYLFSAVKRDADAVKAKYVEIRPMSLPGSNSQGLLEKANQYCFHQLDLRPGIDQIYGGFHRDCVQRKIRRAVREDLSYEEGTSESQLSSFYNMLVLTRRRQGLPPQPRAWFRNLVGCMGDKLKIRIASKDGRPVASILTLSFKHTLVYKYGCSDKVFNNLGGIHLLFWKAIQQAKADGFLQFDLGRSDWGNPGLIAFKDRWGARRSNLEYRILGRPSDHFPSGSYPNEAARWIVGHTPARLLPLVGSLLYRHFHRPPS